MTNRFSLKLKRFVIFGINQQSKCHNFIMSQYSKGTVLLCDAVSQSPYLSLPSLPSMP